MDLWILAGVPITSFVVALSGALMPGPLLTVTVGEATRRGFWAGPLIILGHGILEMAQPSPDHGERGGRGGRNAGLDGPGIAPGLPDQPAQI